MAIPREATQEEVDLYCAMTDSQKVARVAMATYSVAYETGMRDAYIKAKALFQKEVPLMEKVAWFGMGLLCGAVMCMVLLAKVPA